VIPAPRRGELWQDLGMTAAVLWLVAGLLLLGTEVVTGTLVLLMFGGGALAASAASLLGLGLVGSAAVFAVVSVLLLAGRSPLRRRLERHTPHTPTRAEALVGGAATVVARVDGHDGRIRIGDDEWSARAFDGAQVIEAGERVTVVRIAGATALVLADR
jgi:membrane protein implicated in regulation of membrane protease activity